jgi:hypothetical protein
VRQEGQQTRCQKWVNGVIGENPGKIQGKDKKGRQKLSLDNREDFRTKMLFLNIAEVTFAISFFSLLSLGSASRSHNDPRIFNRPYYF